MTDNLPAHSPLGGSGAERWMNCPGSVHFLKLIGKELESDEPDYRRDGTLAHANAAKCLVEGLDAWECMDEIFTEEHALAVQQYLDCLRPKIACASRVLIEQRFHRPDLHADYFGTADCAMYFEAERKLDITDYKHGAGLAVDVEENPQLMYYAYGMLDAFPQAEWIKLRVVQPRIDWREPVLEWQCSVDHLHRWAQAILIPAMEAVAISNKLDAGEHCRFCPAKLVCPLLTGIFRAACVANPDRVVQLGNTTLGNEFKQVQAVKFYVKALEEEIYKRLNRGENVNGAKLVNKKANRVYKSGAEEILAARLGDVIYTKPTLRSPAEVEKINGDAKSLIAEWAYTPVTGTTVALESDKRAAIKVRTAQEAFGAAIEKLKLEDANG